ncbi:MAG: sensor histidine kinase [Thermomicrobiales bacterium]
MLSIRWRLTLFHALAILLIVAMLGVIIVIVAIRGTGSEVEEESHARVLEAARFFELGGALDAETLDRIAGDDVYLVARDSNGAVIAESAEPSQDVEKVSQEERAAIWRETLAAGELSTGTSNELYVHALRIEDPNSPASIIEAWKSYDTVGENIIPYGRVVVFVAPLLLIVTIIGSYLLARSALSPVNAIVRTAREIGERDLSRRLPVKHRRDELGRLATTFNDLLARLEVAFRQREETLAQQRRFAADASHELRTPLTSIQGYARMLRQWALEDPATARESIAAIEREATRMSELVESLLRLARGDEGAPLNPAPHDLGEVAAAAVDATRAAVDGKVGVVYQPPPTPVVATFDHDRIRQATGILLDNAVKFTPEGGSVTVIVRANGQAVELAIADNGLGIAEDHLPHIFDRFYRVDQARTTGGAGLGLAIARQIADQHGGAITVASQPGRGSTFTLTLPAGGADTGPFTAAPQTDHPPPPGRH